MAQMQNPLTMVRLSDSEPVTAQDPAGNSDLTFQDLVDSLEANPEENPSAWKTFVDRTNSMVLCYQVDPYADMPCITNSVRILPDSAGSRLVPLVHVNGKMLKTEFIESVVGQKHLRSMEDAVKLLELVAGIDEDVQDGEAASAASVDHGVGNSKSVNNGHRTTSLVPAVPARVGSQSTALSPRSQSVTFHGAAHSKKPPRLRCLFPGRRALPSVSPSASKDAVPVDAPALRKPSIRALYRAPPKKASTVVVPRPSLDTSVAAAKVLTSPAGVHKPKPPGTVLKSIVKKPVEKPSPSGKAYDTLNGLTTKVPPSYHENSGDIPFEQSEYYEKFMQRRARNAERQRIKRLQETPEQRADRQKRDRDRMRNARASLVARDAEKKSHLTAFDNACAAAELDDYEAISPLDLVRAKNTLQKRAQRMMETPEQRAKRAQKDRERRREKRASLKNKEARQAASDERDSSVESIQK